MIRPLPLAVALCLLVPSFFVRGQDADPVPLRSDELGFTLPGATSILALDTTVFLRGWNWVEMDSLSSAALGVNLWHWRDPWLWQGDADAGTGRGVDAHFLTEHQPRQLLIIAPKNLSMNASTINYTSPVEAMAMEYQPWLDIANGRAVLRDDDSTGGVFGFLHRSSRGRVVKGADSAYRFRLSVDQFNGAELVLANVEHSNALYRVDGYYGGYTTDTLWVSINLRLTDAAQDSGDPDADAIRMRLPYHLHGPCVQDSTYARFRFVPDPDGSASLITSSRGQPVGRRWSVIIDTTSATEITITRRMLQDPSGGVSDITITAGLLFDHDEEGPPLVPWSNPHFNPDAYPLVPYQIDRLGINVEFLDEASVDIKWIRVETPEAQRLFWGAKDEAIRRSVHDLVANMIAFKRDHYPDTEDQPRLHRFYGRDEIRLAHFKGFRYINRLLHGLVTTEWDIEEYDRARHCLGLREFWQGRSFRPHDQTYSYAFLHGYQGSASPDSVYLYCGFKTGRADVADVETDLYGTVIENCSTYRVIPWSPAPLPIPASLRSTFIRKYAGGVQSLVEDYLRNDLHAHSAMLFDSTAPWIQNVWVYSSGVVSVHPRIRFHLVSNGRPKSAEEVRLQHWLPLILGAKGLVEYAGRTTGNVPATTDWEAISGPGSVPWTFSVARDVGTQYTDPDALRSVQTTGSDRIDDDALGPDYLQSGEPDNLDRYITFGLAATASAMNMRRPNAPGIYLGRKSARQVIHEVFTALDPYWDTLRDMRLVAWRAKGYDSWLDGDTNMFQRWIDNADSSYIVIKTSRGDVEPYDSVFFDVTLHTVKNSNDIVLGVLNRRTSGLTPQAPYGRFHTYDSFRAGVRDSTYALYGQEGARTFVLPLRYTDAHGKPVRLRVREMRIVHEAAVDQSDPVDQEILSPGLLTLRLLPGEGKFLRMKVVTD